MGQSREQCDRRAERHHRRRKADCGHEYRADRPAGVVAETLAGAADVGRVELGHERAHRREFHQDRRVERDPELLRLELGELKLSGFDLSLTGFGDLELKDLLTERTEGLTDPDDAPAVPEHPVSE